MNDMNNDLMNPNQLMLELRTLQYDYADCKGDHGPVLKEFTQILKRYQKNFYLWQPIDENATPPEPEHSLVSELIFIAIIAVLFVIFGILLNSGFLAAVFYIIAGIALSLRRESPAWAILSIAATLSLMILGALLDSKIGGGAVWAFAVILVIYAFVSVFKCFSDEGSKKDWETKQQNIARECTRLDNELTKDRQKMNSLLPSLMAEFDEKQKNLITDSDDSVSEEEFSLFNAMPAMFWWQIPPQELVDFASEYDSKNSDGVVWETRLVNRSAGKEFPDAGYEYSPLMEISDTTEEQKQAYDEVKSEFFAEGNGAGVFDFISRGTVSSTMAETFQYEEYAHSDFGRFARKMEWAGLGNDIDKAHNEGRITEEQFQRLSTEYIFASPGVYSNIDAKVEKTGTKYRQVKSSTNIWVGQLLLVNDDTSDGVAVMDYRCQIPHVFKNIEALRDVRITRVYGDPVRRNPMVMAKFHKECELCR